MRHAVALPHSSSLYPGRDAVLVSCGVSSRIDFPMSRLQSALHGCRTLINHSLAGQPVTSFQAVVTLFAPVAAAQFQVQTAARSIQTAITFFWALLAIRSREIVYLSSKVSWS